MKIPTTKCKFCDFSAAMEDLKNNPGFPNGLANQLFVAENRIILS